MFDIFKKKPPQFFTAEENEKIVEAVRWAEQSSSGEVRVFVESRCRFVDPLDRAAELFFGLKMDQTIQRNAVLIYLAMKDHQLAIYGDEGIHQIVGPSFWMKEVNIMISQFNKDNFGEGISKVVREIGEVLRQHFPYDNKGDKNELPDEIVFGK
jgi:uncharacterized membrane protein